jgi:GNAT superfamily N-acetyltransferase
MLNNTSERIVMSAVTSLPTLRITEYSPADAAAFRALNHEWITKYFTLEEIDNQILDNPEGYILAKGGYILMACYQGEPVATCALLKLEEGIFELGKMAVTSRLQGQKIGQTLGKAAIDKARELGAHKLILLSHRSLVPALHVYQKLGFREVPCAPNSYQRADIQMELEL